MKKQKIVWKVSLFIETFGRLSLGLIFLVISGILFDLGGLESNASTIMMGFFVIAWGMNPLVKFWEEYKQK